MRLTTGMIGMAHQANWSDIIYSKAKLEAGVRLNQHMISYGDRPNDYDSVSKCIRLFSYGI